MTTTKSKNNKQQGASSYISISPITNTMSTTSLESLLLTSATKKPRAFSSFSLSSFIKIPALWFALLFFFTLFGMLRLGLQLNLELGTPCASTMTPEPHDPFVSNGYLNSSVGLSDGEFWKQPAGLGLRPCLGFSEEYRRESVEILKDKSKYLMVVVSGGMNQQRNQIVDAVVIARILGASLVVPVLQINLVWGDESEFADIFDMEHFKKTLAEDVHVFSSLPSTHLMSRPVEEKLNSVNVSPRWIHSHYHKKLNREGVLLLRGLDSRLSKDLPPDLQKLRCKVAFDALRFARPVFELGNKIAERMRSKGPYIALHLRMEKDVWVRTGCLPGLSHDLDEIIHQERKSRPELLTAKSNMSYHERKLAGLCPLNAMELTRILKALGAPASARIYWAGGEPLGGKQAFLPLIQEFPHFYSKQDLALPGELVPFENKASLMAAIDYIVSENSNVFMPSHGGNMGRAIQGHRAYAGHKKYITPNKRQILPYLMNHSLPEMEFSKIIKNLHHNLLGEPELRTSKPGRDVTKYPFPDCMCNSSTARAFTVVNSQAATAQKL